MASEYSNIKIIKIRKGDSALKRVNYIVSLLKNQDENFQIIIVNGDSTYQKLFSVVEFAKNVLTSENISFHQYNKLDYCVDDGSVKDCSTNSKTQKRKLDEMLFNSVELTTLTPKTSDSLSKTCDYYSSKVTVVLSRISVPGLQNEHGWCQQ